VPLKSARRLPRRYNRPVSKQMRALVARRRGKHAQFRRQKFLRWWSRVRSTASSMRVYLLRWMLVGICAAGVVVFAYLLFSPVVRVHEISVVRTDPRLDIGQVQTALAPLFGRHPFFVSRLEVYQLLKSRMPDITLVQVEKAYPDTLRVTPQLEPLVARITIVSPDEEQREPVTASGAWSNFMSAQGWYVQTATPQEANDLPELRIVDWGARPVPGDHLLPPPFLERMQATERALETQFGHTTVLRSVYMRGQEFHLLVQEGSSEKRISLWCDTRTSVEEHILRYRLFLQTIGIEAVEEYIDLRLVDRVVYK